MGGFTEIEKDKEIAAVVGGSRKNLEHLLMMNFFLKLTNDIELQMKKHHWRICIRFICNGNLLLTPQMFDHYIAFDPSLWWNNHYLVSEQ